jgi:hypothetical protein
MSYELCEGDLGWDLFECNHHNRRMTDYFSSKKEILDILRSNGYHKSAIDMLETGHVPSMIWVDDTLYPSSSKLSSILTELDLIIYD